MGRRITAEVNVSPERDLRMCLQAVMRLRLSPHGAGLYDAHTEARREHPDLGSIELWELVIEQFGLTVEYERLMKRLMKRPFKGAS